MFIFDPKYTFTWPVKVKLPSSGADETFEFTGRFQLPLDEVAFFASPDDLTPSGIITEARKRIEQVWVGWDGIETPEGLPLPFSTDARANLLMQRPIREAVDRAFSEAWLGLREKN